MVHMSTTERYHGYERSVDGKVHGLGQHWQDYLLRGAFPENHVASEVELGIGAHRLLDELRGILVPGGQTDASDLRAPARSV